ncbi:MAG: outer membrane beta-barrel protein [Candidatus Omnitrophica bacterium]|nr:outer membrane beta-barrel protein [Candidatus Omnitrophota bacterium]
MSNRNQDSFGVKQIILPFLFAQDNGLKITASVNQSYDDNITYSANNTKSDYVSSVGINLNANRQEKLRILSLDLGLTHHLYWRYSGFDNTSFTAEGSFSQEFDKYNRINIRNSFRYADEPSSFEDEFGRTSGRYSYYRNNLSLEYSYDLTKQSLVISRVSAELYDVNRNDLSDSYLWRIGGEYDYAFSSKILTYLLYDFAYRDFSPGKDASFHLFALGTRYFFSSQLYSDTRLGLNLIDSFNNKTYTKRSLYASLTNEFDANTRASFSFSQEYTANRDTQDLFNYRQLSIILGRQITSRLRTGLSAFYGKGKYTVLNIKDTLQGAGVGLEYDLWHNWKVVCRYSYSETDSNVKNRQYQRNYASVGLSAWF